MNLHNMPILCQFYATIAEEWIRGRRCLDTTKAEKEFSFNAKTSFEEGLRKTIECDRFLIRSFI